MLKYQKIIYSLFLPIPALLLGSYSFAQSDCCPTWGADKPIDFIVLDEEGGDTDTMARLIGSVIEEKNMVAEPIDLIYKSNSPSTEAMKLLNNAHGIDLNHTLLVTSGNFNMNQIHESDLGFEIMTFKPDELMAEHTLTHQTPEDFGITLIGSTSMSNEAQEYYKHMLKTVHESPELKEYMMNKSIQDILSTNSQLIE